MTDKARELLLQAWKELLNAYEGSNGERVAKEIHAYLSEPEVLFVRLTDEEICIVMDNVLEGGGWIDVARAIEDALEEKNK